MNPTPSADHVGRPAPPDGRAPRAVADAARETPAGRLAAGFAAQVAGWARRLGEDAATQALLSRAAAAVSAATSNGHVCLGLDELATAGEPEAELRARLLASALVGTPVLPQARPLILDAQGRLYLHRYFDLERRLAARLVRAAAAAPVQPDAATAAQLRELFAGNAARLGGAVDWQQVAAALALRGRLTVISGGPGTGKTTTVVNLLACLVAQDPGCRIALAAPTGKAAARMTEAIRQRAAHLPAALLARLPADASTVHRLLGVRPNGGGFIHHAGHRLALDALVVDEASMLDLALATRLLEAVPEGARIILLGDKDQLAAVESGAVFAELGADPTLTAGCRDELAALCGVNPEALQPPPPAHPSRLHDSVVWFTRNFRFAADSGIGRLAAEVNAGRRDAALAWLRGGADASVRWLEEPGALPAEATLQAMHEGLAPYLDAVRRDPADLSGIFAAFDTFRVLCAVRDGPRGMHAVNERLQAHARQQLAAVATETPNSDAASGTRSPWFTGRPVMVLRNDPVLRLFNGDIGITLPDADGQPMVVFPAGAGPFRAVAPVRLPAHQVAFATTVHKAQGSEFDRVLLLLPQRRNRVLTRELLYTAITRARAGVLLSGPEDALSAAIATPTRRRSGLLARLQDAVATD